VTLPKLHSTAPHGSARPAPDYHVKCERGRYRVYDKQQRFRCEFATMPAAVAYIESRTSHSHNLPISNLPEAA